MKKPKIVLKGRRVVAVIASLADLRIALSHPNIADIFEWRVDCVSGKRVVEGIKRLRSLGRPIILTVRDPREGGKKPHWDFKKRLALMRKYMHLADIIDFEVANAVKLDKKDMFEKARKAGLLIVVSCHFLDGMPHKPDRVWAYDIFVATYGDVFKVAVHINDRREMTRFSKWIMPIMRQPGNEWKIAPMPIGPKYGKKGRLKFAKRGAVLVYGSLAQAVVEGQWKVCELWSKLARMKQ